MRAAGCGSGSAPPLVRHSDPFSEVAETHAKVAGLVSALQSGGASRFGQHPEVVSALRRRNADIAGFWLKDHASHRAAVAESVRPVRPAGLTGLKTLVIDAEDSFTAMLGLQLDALGLQVAIRRFDDATLDGYDLVVMGPGPGDPRADDDPKIAPPAVGGRRTPGRTPALRRRLPEPPGAQQEAGLDLVRRNAPNQGVQREIDLFGCAGAGRLLQHVRGPQYRGPAPTSTASDRWRSAVTRLTGEVHALRGPRFASMQFHAESVLTVDGPRIVADSIRRALGHEA